MAHMLYHNLYVNFNPKEVKSQRIKLPKLYLLSLRWPRGGANFIRRELKQLGVMIAKAPFYQLKGGIKS